MKKLLFTVLFVLVGVFSTVSAQDTPSVIDRYKKAMGLAQTYFDDNVCMVVKMKMSSGDRYIPCTFMRASRNRYRAEMVIDSLDILTVVSGDKGWISMSGSEVQVIPKEQFFQMVGKYDPLAGMYWDGTFFDFTLLDPVSENGKEYDVVRAVLKKSSPSVKYQDIYFDPATGLPAFSDARTNDEGTIRVRYKEYKTSGNLTYPSMFESSLNGEVFFHLTIESLRTDYPVTDEMFAEPKQKNK